MLAISWSVVFISSHPSCPRTLLLGPSSAAVPTMTSRRRCAPMVEAGRRLWCKTKAARPKVNFLFRSGWGTGLRGLRAQSEGDPGLPIPGPAGHRLERGESRIFS